MAEYIERGTGVSIFRAKANMAVLMDAAPYFEKAAQMLEQLPTVDAVVVIRCKDCKHFNFEHMECENEAVSTDHEGGASYSLNFYLDDFCSFGERKE